MYRYQASASSRSGWPFFAGDGARRLLIRRLELLALGGVLVDLAEDLVPLRYQLFDAIANLVFHGDFNLKVQFP